MISLSKAFKAIFGKRIATGLVRVDADYFYTNTLNIAIDANFSPQLRFSDNTTPLMVASYHDKTGDYIRRAIAHQNVDGMARNSLGQNAMYFMLEGMFGFPRREITFPRTGRVDIIQLCIPSIEALKILISAYPSLVSAVISNGDRPNLTPAMYMAKHIADIVQFQQNDNCSHKSKKYKLSEAGISPEVVAMSVKERWPLGKGELVSLSVVDIYDHYLSTAVEASKLLGVKDDLLHLKLD